MFINYRGADTHSYGALLYTELSRHFGTEFVFLDAESIPGGADFVEELLGRVRSARVLLAVIGPSWLTATDPSGRRRIDDPNDWIRRELVEAFAAHVRVIPILTEQTELPAAADLPADIAALNRCQYRRLRYREPIADLGRIVADLTVLEPALAEAARGRVDVSAVHRPSPHEEALADKADELADAIRRGLEHGVEQQRILDHDPLPMHWRPLRGDAADHRPGDPADPSPPDLVRHLNDLVTAYERTKSGWLLVRGRAGSGKTALVMRFALARLNQRDRRRPAAVPVIFSVGSWNPRTTPLSPWLIRQLERNQPFLVGPGPSRGTWAEALVSTRRILPILDGFDEIAIGQRKAALTALNASALPLLVTSRKGELEAARKGGRVEPFATGIELTDLTLDDCVDYLLRASDTTLSGDDPDPIPPTGWKYVLSELRNHRERPASARLATVLTTPLMVTLVRFIYESDRDPAELLDTVKFPTEESLEDHILDSFIPTSYARLPSGRAAAGEDGRRDAERAQHWLGHLAVHLTKLGTHDIEWWRLGTTMPRSTVMIMVGVAVGVVSGLVAGLAYGFQAGLEGGLATGFEVGLFNVALNGLGLGLTFGIMHGFATKLKVGAPTFEPSLMQTRFRHGERRRVRASFLPRLRAGLVGGTLFGGMWGLETAVATAIQGGTGPEIALSGATMLAIGIVLGTEIGITTALGAGFDAVIEKADRDKIARPSDLLSRNRTTVLTQMLLVALVIGASHAVIFGLRYGTALGLVAGPVAGIMVGLGIGTLTAWGRWVVLARVWLPMTGRLPRDVNAFLDDAYRRGVLRQVGAVYQFRHARLRDRLTAVHRERR